MYDCMRSEFNSHLIDELKPCFSGITHIRHNPTGKKCKKILGFDANALYLSCMAEQMPCGLYIRRKAENNFVKQYPTPLSAVANEWLSYVEDCEHITLKHARNNTEQRIGPKKIPVDGFCRDKNTVFNFHGCYWHGCKTCLPNNRDASKPGKHSLNEKYKHTKKISEYILSLGYNLKEMWECEWKNMKKSIQLSDKYFYPLEEKFRMTEKEVLENIRNEKIFGVVEVDIYVPEHLKEYFSEMTPIFKNTNVPKESISDFMANYIKKTDRKFSERRCLIGSMFAEKILLITPLLNWYLEHGLVVKKIYQIIQFNPKKCFSRFADTVSDDRRAGDLDKSKEIVADTSKLIGNSVYGHTIMNKSRHTSVKFCDYERATKLVNDPRFMEIYEFDEEFFEVHSKKRTIKYDLPIQIGFFVYQEAKLKMLSFFYDVIDHFISRSDYCLLEMDTDSLYMALSGKSLDELVKPELRSEWFEVKTHFFPREDTDENIRYDKRTPGLFKVEWQGDGFIGLNSKTYYCFNNNSDIKDKYSAKGVNRTVDLQKEDYMDALEGKVIDCQTNKGFVMKDDKMYTYALRKQGLSSYYVKRMVLENGVSTTYLNI